MWKFLRYLFFGWIVVSIVTAPLYWPYLRMVWVYNTIIAAPKYDTPSNEREAKLQDLDYLSTLTEYDRSFNDEEKVAFAAAVEAIADDIDEMSEAALYLRIAEAVALADNGHTNVSYRPQYTKFNTIGARFYAFEDGLFIVSSAPEKVHTLGRRVVSIEDQPIDEVRASLRRYRGGNTVWRDLYTILILESPELLEAAGIANSSVSITLELEDATGDIERVVFEGMSRGVLEEAPSRRAWQSLVPGSFKYEQIAWSHILEADAAPPARYLTTPDEILSYELQGSGLYIRALPGFAVGDQAIKGAYKELLADHAEGSLDYLVVDFRLHDGGDYTKSMEFARTAPKAVKPDGAVYIITGPNTFSAAIVTVAMLKYYAGDRAMIIGEQMGDREQFWAERGTSFQLPNSGYYINYATGFHNWETGCKGQSFCYTLNEMHEVPAGSLTPVIVLSQPFQSYQSGEDIVMDWIAKRQ